MKQHLVLYGLSLVIIGLLDFVWLGWLAKSFYAENLAGLLAPDIKIFPAAFFYVVYPIGLLIFAMAPSAESGDWARAALMGGLFGFFAYMTYDMSNWATLKGFPSIVAWVDMAWGTSCGALTSGIAVFAAKRILG
jgi:uncharacterized membrane protein